MAVRNLLLAVFNRETSSRGSDDLATVGRTAGHDHAGACEVGRVEGVRGGAERTGSSGRGDQKMGRRLGKGGGADDRAAPSPVAAADRSPKQIGKPSSSKTDPEKEEAGGKDRGRGPEDSRCRIVRGTRDPTATGGRDPSLPNKGTSHRAVRRETDGADGRSTGFWRSWTDEYRPESSVNSRHCAVPKIT